MTRKNKSLLTVVSLNNIVEKGGPQVNPFDNYDAGTMDLTQQSKLNLVKANVGEIVSDKEKSR